MPVGYEGIHDRVRRVCGPASARACVDCGGPAAHWSYRGGCPEEWCDPRPYCQHVECYEPRCQPCHWAYDGIAQVGSAHPGALLTEDDVIELRARRAAGESFESLGAAYGISPATVRAIAAGRIWKHLPVLPRNSRRRIPIGEHDTIRALHADGATNKEIAERYGVSEQVIQPITATGRKRPRTSPEILKLVLERLRRGDSQVSIARDYGLDPSTVSRIASRHLLR